MSDGHRKSNKPPGPAPKLKYSNNTRDDDNPPNRSNPPSTSWHVFSDSANFIRNPRRTQRNNYIVMDTAFEEQNIPLELRNGLPGFPNGNIATPETSSSASRRNSTSSTLKCDNVTKYPDKKQIEDKLSQIREYLQITNSLVASAKNADEQLDDIGEKNSLIKMRNDLMDSEKKLVKILEEMSDTNLEKNQAQVSSTSNVDNMSDAGAGPSRRNDVDINGFDNLELDALREQQLYLLKLQQQAENKLRDARLVQEKMLSQGGNQVNLSNQKDNKNMSLTEFDAAIKELEERAKRINNPRNVNPTDRIMSEVESLHNKIISMHNANNEREQLIEVLDTRDAELWSQQAELQKRLFELQNKKQQVDQLASQLQIFTDDDEGSDVGVQVRKIVTMKDQLKKLKDMLEIVKSTENVMANPNVSSEAQVVANEICLTAENFLENQLQKPRPLQNETNIGTRFENNTSNETCQKQTNTRNQSRTRPKASTSGINEKIALQAELEAKKKELEEIMGKHKAGTSNLNHDVGTDNKSEYSSVSNSLSARFWKPPVISHDQEEGSDRFSSDECDENEYSEIHENENLLPTEHPNYYAANLSKGRSENSEYDISTERLHSYSHTPERNLRSMSVATSDFVREQPRPNNDQEKLQKQLQLIKSVCDSMLEQHIVTSQPQASFQQLRNNITPTSVYSEPHRYSANALNTLNPNPEGSWYASQNPNGQGDNNMTNYQNWLATNTLQTQSFMLNTLNQCCQMLWLQQRELVALRNAVSVLQEKIDSTQYPAQGHLAPPPQHPQPLEPNRSSNQFRSTQSQKHNQVSAACSMPNLNHYSTPHSNIDPAYANLNNMPNGGRLLDTCLNNSVPVSADHVNNMLHAVNSNLNHPIPAHMWNGQALNNQVAPGNRANNYWDNFRSYSRQNLLSTKNEGFQNASSSSDRSHGGPERTNPFTLMSASKSNSEHSTGTSHENTPQRKVAYNVPNHAPNVKTSSTVPPPDVLNINQTASKLFTGGEFPSTSGHQGTSEELSLGLHMLLNLNPNTDSAVSVNPPEDHASKSDITQRNEWHEGSSDQSKKVKPFDELRENVYKEVASLISANEARPHFLIQLFRDLQRIESDSLRLKILQSVQNVLTHSLTAQQILNRQVRDSDTNTIPDSIILPPMIWSNPSSSAGTSHCMDNCMSHERKDSVHSAVSFNADVVLLNGSCQNSGNTENNMQNGDLAEADQSRVIESDTEEDGPVGNLVDVNETEAQASSEEMLSVPEFPSNGEGLDQVPTRLPTKNKSRSTTPNKDHSSHHDSEPY